MMKNKSMTFGDGTESIQFFKASSNDYVLSPTIVST